MPSEMTDWMLPVHLALEGVRSNWFDRQHADIIGHTFDLATVDMLMPGKGDKRSMLCIHYASITLDQIRDRAAEGDGASVTDEEFEKLCAGVTLVDRYVRTWTTTRRRLAEGTLKLMKAEIAG